MAFLSKDRKTNIARIANTLLLAGCPIAALPMVTAQVCYETAYFSNEGANLYNNFSGIKYAGQVGATKAPKAVHDSGAGGYYAVYKTPLDWAKDHIRIINRVGPLGSPISATSVTDYVSRLRANKYFEGSPDAYSAGLASIVKKQLDGVIPTGWDVATVLKAAATGVRAKIA